MSNLFFPSGTIIFGCLFTCLIGFASMAQPARAESVQDSAVSEAMPASKEATETKEEEENAMTLEHGKINTNDASPVDPGHYEIEPSFSFTQAKRSWDASGDSRDRGLFREQNIGLSVQVGLFDNVDMAVIGGYSWLKDEDNSFADGAGRMGATSGYDFTDTEVRGRYRFYNNEKQRLELAYIAGVIIPTGSGSDADNIGTSQEFWSLAQSLVATKDWQRVTLNGEAGFALPLGGKRENARGLLNLNLAVGYHIFSWLQPEVELNYSHNFSEDADDAQTLAATAGLIILFNDRIRLMAGIQQDMWGENADKTTTLCGSVKFNF